MKSKKRLMVWLAGTILTLCLAGISLAGAGLMAPGDPAQVTGDFSVVGGDASDPSASLHMEAASFPTANLTKQDYFAAYTEASMLLDHGVHFRARELQRLDPATCGNEPENENACSFSVTSIENNYLDFNDGRLYWRFCADYDEPYVGVGAVEQDMDDPGNQLVIDAFGYCPFWRDLNAGQKGRRVGGWESNPLSNDGEIDVRNQLIGAQRLYAALAVAEPATLTFDGLNGGQALDLVTVRADGSIVWGEDGAWDRARDLGVYGLLETTHELASVHLIFGNEFMIDASRYPFSLAGVDSEQIVRQEQMQLQRALHQYQLAVNVFMYALNYHLGGAENGTMARYFGDREFQTFSSASERAVTALTEIAKRDRLLGQDGDGAALARMEESMLDQYFQALALSGQSRALVDDDPSTPDIDEGQTHFLRNGGRDILNNIRRLSQQIENIRAGLNPLGYEATYVPLKPFEDLMVLTCGGETVCTQGGGLLNEAFLAGQALDASQREFDQQYEKLKSELTDLEFDYDNTLTELCGASTDGDGDGLKDFIPCGFFDANQNDAIDGPSETRGLIGQNYWDMIAAEKGLSLAVRQAENNIEQIRSEEERAQRVIDVILSTGQTLSAYQLAIGKLNAYKSTDSVATSSNASAYFDVAVETSVGTKVTSKASANPIDCILGGCGVEFETWLELALKSTVGARAELALISTSETVWSPNDEIIGQFESLAALKQAEQEAEIVGAESAARVKELLLEQSELLGQIEIAQAQFNKTVSEHNLLVEQYLLTMTQRTSTEDWLLNDTVLTKPYFRLIRDGAALEAVRTLDQAQQAAYLTAKALEYYTLSPVDYLHDLYRVRNPSNLRAFLNELAGDYAAISPEKFSKVTYRLSLAEDVLGLSDENLNPRGTLNPEEVEALRYQRFQQILANSHLSNAETGFDSIVIPFATTLDNHKFLRGVFNNRIARTSNTDPGCTAGDGCRGLWLNVVTDQDAAEFEGDLPKIRLTHAGNALYRDGNLREVSYDPGPALMVGRTLPAGFGGSGRESALMTTHLNLPPGVGPDLNFTEDNFFNLSIATTQWNIQIDLTNPLENTRIDISKIRDIELRMDTTYLTSNLATQLAAADSARVRAETAGLEVPEAIRQELAALEPAYGQVLSEANPVHFQAPANTGPQADADEYTGSLTILSPVALGTMDMGFSLSIDGSGNVSGTICAACSPLYDTPEAMSGIYDAAEGSLSLQTAALTRVIAGRTATRQITLQGQVRADDGAIAGSYTETITGLIAVPIVSEGTFLVSRRANTDFSGPAQFLLAAEPATVDAQASASVRATLRDGKGRALAGVDVTFSADLGSVSPQTVPSDAGGIATTQFQAGGTPGTATITATAEGMEAPRTILIQIRDSAPEQQRLFLPSITK